MKKSFPHFVYIRNNGVYNVFIFVFCVGDTSACDTMDCNNGHCQELLGYAFCICAPGWQGLNCERGLYVILDYQLRLCDDCQQQTSELSCRRSFSASLVYLGKLLPRRIIKSLS